MLAKIVFTGTTCAGKSTLLERFKTRGYNVIEEAARKIISERKGKFVDARENLIRQTLMTRLQVEHEKYYENGSKDKYILLDRSLVDIAAFAQMLIGYVPDEIDIVARSARYDIVFFLERVPYFQDDIRTEISEDERSKIERYLKQEYTKYGFSPIFVPKMPLEERFELIESHIGGGKVKWPV